MQGQVHWVEALCCYISKDYVYDILELTTKS